MSRENEERRNPTEMIVPQRDAVEFSSGVFLGAILGAGLALLVAPDRTPRRRLERRLRRPRRRVRRQARQASTATGEAARASAGLGRELHALGTEVARAVREELVAPGMDRFLPGRADRRSRRRLDRASRRMKEFRSELSGVGRH